MFRAMVQWADPGEVSDEYLAANLPDFATGYAAMIAAAPPAGENAAAVTLANSPAARDQALREAGVPAEAIPALVQGRERG